MGNYIKTSKHPKSVRAIQLLSYLDLLTILAAVMTFIYFSLESPGGGDSLIFFLITFLIMLAGSLNSAIGISLPNSGKFEYFRPALVSLTVCSFVGLINGIKEMGSADTNSSESISAMFYFSFFLICFVSNVINLHFFAEKISRKAAVISSTIQTLAILVYILFMIYAKVNSSGFFTAYTTKQVTIIFMCNVIMLITMVTTLLEVLIKPPFSGKSTNDDR